MVGIIKITRNLASSMGNVFIAFRQSVCLALVRDAIGRCRRHYYFSTPTKIIGEGGPSLTLVAATVGGMLLFAAGGGWAWHKFGEERAVRLGGLLVSLILPAAIGAVAIGLRGAWDVPDIWHRPFAVLTLGDIGQNILKLVVLFCGVSFISAVVRKLFSNWRKG
jgi:hypothetical protein